MIARILVFLIVLIILPDLYIDRHYKSKKKSYTWSRRILWWLPSFFMTVCTVGLAGIRNFVPDTPDFFNFYLLLLAVLVVPKAFFALFSALGLLYCRLLHKRHNWGNFIGLAAAFFTIYVALYGAIVGFGHIEVKHIDVYSADLPASFDGYRIVQFTDAHVGSFDGSRKNILRRAVDSINAQHADLIAFTGDLQNIQPKELYPVRKLLSSLRATDGVYSVLGNHDYSMYIEADAAVKAANEHELIARQRQFGWTLLRNENRSIRRGADSIVIAGEENDGEPPFPSRADLSKTLTGVDRHAYVVLLQHDPSAWRRDILPHSNVQLTLSGHTHAGQFSLFGWRPSRMKYAEDYGLYTSANRSLYVSAGIGGLLPFRFGVPAEITVLTLHQKK